MFSAKQLFPNTANARSEALAVLSLFGLTIEPNLTEEAISNLSRRIPVDMGAVNDIPDAYAGLIIIYNHLIKYQSVAPHILSIIAVFKDELLAFTAEIFTLLIKKEPLENIMLILALSDNKYTTLVSSTVKHQACTTRLNTFDWTKTTNVVPQSTAITGLSFNLGLLLEHTWNEHNYVV
jgi:hypothetical protein